MNKILNLIKYISVLSLVLGLAACGEEKKNMPSEATPVPTTASSDVSGNDNLSISVSTEDGQNLEVKISSEEINIKGEGVGDISTKITEEVKIGSQEISVGGKEGVSVKKNGDINVGGQDGISVEGDSINIGGKDGSISINGDSINISGGSESKK